VASSSLFLTGKVKKKRASLSGGKKGKRGKDGKILQQKELSISEGEECLGNLPKEKKKGESFLGIRTMRCVDGEIRLTSIAEGEKESLGIRVSRDRRTTTKKKGKTFLHEHNHSCRGGKEKGRKKRASLIKGLPSS